MILSVWIEGKIQEREGLLQVAIEKVSEDCLKCSAESVQEISLLTPIEPPLVESLT